MGWVSRLILPANPQTALGTAAGFQLQINVCHIGIARAQRICNAYKRFIVVNVFSYSV